MSNASRKSRGTNTQALGAEWFRDHGFPYATDAGAGRTGRDILNLIGLACEVKARAGFDPLAWIRQAERNAAGDVPFVLFRCNGQGPAAIGDWPVLLRLSDFTTLIRAAGYGDPETTNPEPAAPEEPECFDLHKTLVDGMPMVPWDHWGRGCPYQTEETTP